MVNNDKLSIEVNNYRDEVNSVNYGLSNVEKGQKELFVNWTN